MSDGQTRGERLEKQGKLIKMPDHLHYENEVITMPHHLDPDLVLLQNALDGDRGKDQKRIAEVGLKWLSTLLRKNHDYESSAWETPVLLPDLSVGDSILLRIGEKIKRLRALRAKQNEVTDDSFSGTMGDLGSYCLLWLSRPED